MKKAASKLTKPMIFFLFLLFIILTFYIVTWITNIYRGSTAYFEQGSKAGLECVGYAYDVYDISYEQGVLSFTLKNAPHSDRDITSLVVDNHNETVEQNFTIGPGHEITLSAKILINNTFALYPRNCNKYAKQCTLEGCQ